MIPRVVLLGALTPLFVVLAVRAEPVTVKQASPQDKHRAQKAYLQAMDDFEGGRLKDALRGFERSYEIVHSPNSRFMVARTLARMGRNAEAYVALDAVIEEAEALGGQYAATAEAARAKQAEIRPRIGKLAIDASKLPKQTQIQVDELSYSAEKLPPSVPVLPGDVKVVAVLPTGEKIEKKVKVESGGEGALDLGAPRKKNAKGPEVEGGPFIERSRHREYKLEVEGHWMFTTLEPPGPPNQGVGPGVRFSLELLPRGIFDGLNDGLGVSTGVDWVVTSVPDHYWVPVVAQYSVWVGQDLSIFLEPGVALKFVDDTALTPAVQLGARYVLRGKVAVVLRAGIPAASAGLSILF